jgi:hypothetical protein
VLVISISFLIHTVHFNLLQGLLEAKKGSSEEFSADASGSWYSEASDTDKSRESTLRINNLRVIT